MEYENKKKSSLFQKIGNSIDIDKRLYKEDIAGSIAHVEMLFKQKPYLLNPEYPPRFLRKPNNQNLPTEKTHLTY